MPKKRILFFAEAVTLAHVARPLVLAQALNPDRYDIYFASDPRFNDLFSDVAIPRLAIRSITSQKFLANLAAGKPLYDVNTLRDYVSQELDLIRELDPDLVVGDFRLSLAVSGPVAQTPYVALSNAYWSPHASLRFPVPELPFVRIVGTGLAQILFDLARPIAFALHCRPLNQLRREHGLKPLGGDLRRLYTWADHTVYADIPELTPTQQLPANHHYIGPVLWSPHAQMPPWWNTLPTDRPIIYVTFGSSGRSDLLPTVLQALSELRVTVIAATAGRINLDQIPENVFIADYLPGKEAVSRARLVICNGGSPATQQALVQGVPVLGIPSNLDQHLNMEVVRKSDAGILLRAEQVTILRLKEVVRQMLESAAYASAAARLARHFARYDAPTLFSALIERII